jgi:sterol desaturase/sphingolipid hydroxylase (fatty acid hydroxylase superfamily)
MRLLFSTANAGRGATLQSFLNLSQQTVLFGVVLFFGLLLGYMTRTLLIIYVYRLFWNKGLSKYKIQQRDASGADIRREIICSLRTMLIFSLLLAGVYLGAQTHVFTVYRGVQPLGVAYLLTSAIAMILGHDAYFYWTHRLMHHPRLYSMLHRTHHKSITPTAFACYSFDVPEAIVHGLFVPIWLLVFPMQLGAIWFALSFMFTLNALGHSGVEVFPNGSFRRRWFGWFSSNTRHDLHHSAFHYNFALYFTWWDRWMGTEHPLSRQAREIPLSDGAEAHRSA